MILSRESRPFYRLSEQDKKSPYRIFVEQSCSRSRRRADAGGVQGGRAQPDGWSARDGACRFPGAACRGGQLTSLSLAAVPLNANFRAVVATLLQLGAIERLSLRGTNVRLTVAKLCGKL